MDITVIEKRKYLGVCWNYPSCVLFSFLLYVFLSSWGGVVFSFCMSIVQVMQVPLSHVEDIIGIGGANIVYIRRTSGAVLTVQESRGLPEEINIEIKGTSSEVQAAEQLIQEFINNHKEQAPRMYGTREPEFGSFSRYGDPYSSSSFQSQRFEGYGSSSLGGYNRYRY